MAFSEDLTPFFNDAEFALEASLAPGGPGLVIYDENGALVEQFNVEASGPVVVCPTSQWPDVAIGDTLTIGASTFTVRSALAVDDGALTLLTLVRTA